MVVVPYLSALLARQPEQRVSTCDSGHHERLHDRGSRLGGSSISRDGPSSSPSIGSLQVPSHYWETTRSPAAQAKPRLPRLARDEHRLIGQRPDRPQWRVWGNLGGRSSPVTGRQPVAC